MSRSPFVELRHELRADAAEQRDRAGERKDASAESYPPPAECGVESGDVQSVHLAKDPRLPRVELRPYEVAREDRHERERQNERSREREKHRRRHRAEQLSLDAR